MKVSRTFVARKRYHLLARWSSDRGLLLFISHTNHVIDWLECFDLFSTQKPTCTNHFCSFVCSCANRHRDEMSTG